MTTHYDPYSETLHGDITACGTVVGDKYSASANWNHVDCRRCQKQKDRIVKTVEREEEAIIKQMGEFADFVSKQDPEGVTNA